MNAFSKSEWMTPAACRRIQKESPAALASHVPALSPPKADWKPTVHAGHAVDSFGSGAFCGALGTESLMRFWNACSKRCFPQCSRTLQIDTNVHRRTCGAVMPARMVQARVSLGPAVKYVRRPSCLYVAAMRLQAPDRGRVSEAESASLRQAHQRCRV